MKLLQIILTEITNITQIVSNIFIVKTKYLIIIICFTALFQLYSYSNEPNIDLIVNQRFTFTSNMINYLY